MEHSICLKVHIDPSTPISSLLQSLGKEPSTSRVDGSTSIADALKACEREGCEYIIIRLDGAEKAVSASELLKALPLSPGEKIEVLATHSIPAFKPSTSLQSVVASMVLQGTSAIAIQEDGKISHIITLESLSKIIGLEIDVEELRGAD